jgi:RNA polymerase sigma-70 factor (ECF subfamily)
MHPEHLYGEPGKICRVVAVVTMPRALVERAIGGDHDAFSVLVRASLARLYAVASLILRDGDHAQDAVQDALILAWRDVRALRNPNAWEPWLYRLTVRACYRHVRRERRRALVELHVELDPDGAGGADMTITHAQRDLMQRELGRLAIDQRAVLVLHFYLGLPLTDAADILDIPIGTAKSRLHRGLEAIRASLRAKPEPELGAGAALAKEWLA